MADTKFTPGPWGFHIYGKPTVRSFEHEGRTVEHADFCIGVGDKLIAQVRLQRGECVGYPGVENEEEFTANAHLIAAAPELYEAAKRALNFIENTENSFDMKLDSGDALRAALAKARGEKSA